MFMNIRSEYTSARGCAGWSPAEEKPASSGLGRCGQGGPRQRETLMGVVGPVPHGRVGQHVAEQGPELERMTRAARRHNQASLTVEDEILVGGHRVQAGLRGGTRPVHAGAE